jgi:hypothetical protein
VPSHTRVRTISLILGKTLDRFRSQNRVYAVASELFSLKHKYNYLFQLLFHIYPTPVRGHSGHGTSCEERKAEEHILHRDKDTVHLFGLYRSRDDLHHIQPRTSVDGVPSPTTIHATTTGTGTIPAA